MTLIVVCSCPIGQGWDKAKGYRARAGARLGLV